MSAVVLTIPLAGLALIRTRALAGLVLLTLLALLAVLLVAALTLLLLLVRLLPRGFAFLLLRATGLVVLTLVHVLVLAHGWSFL